MKLDEVPTVLDVHPPHESIHGTRDFLLHLLTITVGLDDQYKQFLAAHPG